MAFSQIDGKSHSRMVPLGFSNGEHSFEEYIEDAYRISVAVVLTIHLAIVVLKIKTMLKLLTNCQEALEQSESIK